MVQNTLKTSLDQSLMVDNASNSSGDNGVDLTPTTLKSITQLFESSDCLHTLHKIEDDGFAVPLPVTTPTRFSSRKSFFKLDSNSWHGGTTTVVTPTKSEQMTILGLPESVENTNIINSASETAMLTRSSSRVRTLTPAAQSYKKQATTKRTPAKKRPGVKTKHDEDNLSPEEAGRLHMRRERNKDAAARCRKRRIDQITTLSVEVEQWEGKKRILENTIAQLRAQKDELEYILNQHSTECKFSYEGGNNHASVFHTSMVEQPLPVAVKSEPVVVEPIEQIFVVQASPTHGRASLKHKRPLTLVIGNVPESRTSSIVEGVVIETPSNGMTSLGFDSLMTSTGLTPNCNIITPVSFSLNSPYTPTCSSQQRSSELILADLNTPSNETFSLVSL
jgi:hypothetical protein